MKKIAAIYTALALVEPLKKLCSEHLPNYQLINILDDSVIGDVIRKGKVDSSIIRRLIDLYQCGVDAGADVIINTCSSVGEVVDIARSFIDVPILKIDEPMVSEAVKKANKIGVLATLPTTLNPTIRLVKKQAENAGKKIEIIDGLAVGGFEALMAGEPEEHDRLILETAIRIASQADILVLAQGSMARMEQTLALKTGKRVLSSPLSGMLAIKALFE
jgi:aspartate/glutamate racemase